MKGLVGGIPLALLVAAVQVQAMEHGAQDNSVSNHGFHQRRQAGGTALGGPSGKDEDGDFPSPFSAHVKTQTNVNEFSKDDHSIKVKSENVFPVPPPPHPFGPALGPGAGPFPDHEFGPALAPGAGPFPEHAKRSWPEGGTAIGGPSGNDEGQSFDMPITGNFYTNVNEYNQDDHSVKVKNEDIYPPPVPAPVGHPPVQHPPVAHPPAFRNDNDNGPSDHFHVPAAAFGKRWGTEAGGTALGGPGGGSEHGNHVPGHFGGTALGGPSGDDEGISFSAPVTGHFETNVNEAYKDDHSVDIKHKDIHAPPPFPPFGRPFKRHWGPTEGGTVLGGPSGDDGGVSFSTPVTVDTHANVNEAWKDDHSIDLKHKDVYAPPPFPPFGKPFKRWGPKAGGTALGGPSGNDGGQSFSAPITVNTYTSVSEDYEDDHSIDLKHKDQFVAPPPPPFGFPKGPGPIRRAYAPERQEGGGTALGGPSGDDDGVSFSDPTDIDVGANVNEQHDDNHAIKSDTTDVHLPPHQFHDVPHMPWMQYPAHQDSEPAGVPEHTTSTAPQPVNAPEPAEPAQHEAPPAPAVLPSNPVDASEHQESPPRADHDEVPQCSAQDHEVVRTVTKTQYQEVHPTETFYAQIPTSHAVETAAVPEAFQNQPESYNSGAYASQAPSYPSSNPGTPYDFSKSYAAAPSSNPGYNFGASPSQDPSVDFGSFPSSGSDPSYNYGASPSRDSSVGFASFPTSGSDLSYNYGASPSQDPSVGFASFPTSGSDPSYNYGASPSSEEASGSGSGYSKIPVDVPLATPSSSRYMGSLATPASSMVPMMPSAVSPQQSASYSAKPSSPVAMFTGTAGRVSGGLVSAAAAVAGVLAFVL